MYIIERAGLKHFNPKCRVVIVDYDNSFVDRDDRLSGLTDFSAEKLDSYYHDVSKDVVIESGYDLVQHYIRPSDMVVYVDNRRGKYIDRTGRWLVENKLKWNQLISLNGSRRPWRDLMQELPELRSRGLVLTLCSSNAAECSSEGFSVFNPLNVVNATLEAVG